jgi:hypothetical protein
MNSYAVQLTLGAALFSLPLVSHAQRNLGTPGPAVRHDVTLLTGPYLLSPASPPKSPVEGQEWSFIPTRATLSATPPARGTGTLSLQPSENRPAWAADAELADAQQKLQSARERLQRLQAEKEAARQRQKEFNEAAGKARVRNGVRILRTPAVTPLFPEDPIRFDARMPDAPRLQLSKPAETTTEPKRD